MRLLWKLLRGHISFPQLTGFFLANLFGMTIVLLSIQFYKDTLPIFTGKDSFIKDDYMVVTKRISTLGSFIGQDNTFKPGELKEISGQPFTKRIGKFIPSQFKVSAGMGMPEAGIRFSTDMFFESVPDEYIDVKLDKWHFDPSDPVIPIILPRNYLDLYNFGFAQARNLPKISEGLMGLIRLDVFLSGNDKTARYKGNIVGFSNRLNTILVPEEFMQWANREFAPDKKAAPSRLIVEVKNPADERIARFFQEKGYVIDNDKLDAGKTAYFLKLITGIVLAIGLIISALSFYILMLSVYLLLQKNTAKLENLLLIGYSPVKVALPYQLLITGLNALVFLLSVGIVWQVREYYLKVIVQFYPQLPVGGLWPALLAGIVLFGVVSAFNMGIVRKKVFSIWLHR